MATASDNPSKSRTGSASEKQPGAPAPLMLLRPGLAVKGAMLMKDAPVGEHGVERWTCQNLRSTIWAEFSQLRVLIDDLLAKDVCVPAVLGEFAERVEVHPAQGERAAPVAVDQAVEAGAECVAVFVEECLELGAVRLLMTSSAAVRGGKTCAKYANAEGRSNLVEQLSRSVRSAEFGGSVVRCHSLSGSAPPRRRPGRRRNGPTW